MPVDLLVLGPLLRYVDRTSASIWVETSARATVTVHGDDRSWSAATFTVHGHHYALAEIDGLQPGSRVEYRVEIDGTPVWPPRDSPYPPSVLATFADDAPLRLAFGSCRTSVPHDRMGNLLHGVDAMRAYALQMAATERHGEDSWRPDLLLFLGDQVYADETSQEMRQFIASRRDIDAPPGEELKDFEEYAHLYRLAWSDPANRWLLSTVPSLMIFDDHDIRDDWNTSDEWRRRMAATSWWHERIVAGLGAYWVYQHLGNMSPAERADDELWRAVVQTQESENESGSPTAAGPESVPASEPAITAEVAPEPDFTAPAVEPDITAALDAFAERVDAEPTAYRWSYVRDIGDVRLIVVDSRAARVLDPDRRSMLDPDELAWLDGRLTGGPRHILVGTSLPFLLSPGLHHLEAWNEALVEGAWGGRGTSFGEWLRQRVDLEHWGAFQHGFAEVAAMVLSVAAGERGPAPDTITFLSGDVHHSYVSEVRHLDDRPLPRTRIVQVVCSPIRNPLPRVVRFATAALSYGLAGPMGAVAARSAKVPDPPFSWGLLNGPWFDNNLAVLTDHGAEGLRFTWYTGDVRGGDHAHPELEEVASAQIAPGGRGRRSRLTGPVSGRVVARLSRMMERRRRSD